MQDLGYEVTAEFEESHWWYLSRQVLVESQLEIASNKRETAHLDYGCGTGFLLEAFSRYSSQVVGADVSAHILGEAAKNKQFQRIDLNEDCSNYYGQFDLLTALDVLEHIDDDLEGLKQMMKFLKPGGQIILTVPAYNCLWGDEDIISEHKRRYTKTALQRVCIAAGAEIKFISYFNVLLLPAIATIIWGRKLLGTNSKPKSNLSHLPKWLNSVLLGISSMEAKRVGSESVTPWMGASIVCRFEI